LPHELLKKQAVSVTGSDFFDGQFAAAATGSGKLRHAGTGKSGKSACLPRPWQAVCVYYQVLSMTVTGSPQFFHPRE
jgi:hypothetical protein